MSSLFRRLIRQGGTWLTADKGLRIEILLVLAVGLALYPLLAFGDRLIATSSLGSALFEEAVKVLLLFAAASFGRWQFFRRAAAKGQLVHSGGKSPRKTRGAATPSDKLVWDRGLLSATARGFGLGLAAVAIFASLENLAYFLAFPTIGVLGRLLWSEPVHLVAALAEAIGLFQLFKRARAFDPGRGGSLGPVLRIIRKAGLCLSGIALGIAWHLYANYLASGSVSPALFAAVAAANIAALLALGRIFAQQVVIGGFVYGAE